MTKYNITQEQINEVCAKVAEVMMNETAVQNCTYPTTQIVEGIKTGLSPEEIGNNCYNCIIDAPAAPSQYFVMSARTTLHNLGQFMSGVTKEELKKYVDTTPEGSEEPEEEVQP